VETSCKCIPPWSTISFRLKSKLLVSLQSFSNSIVGNDFLHIQWTGADSNQQGNAGQGRAGTDRNNLVIVSDLGKNMPTNLEYKNLEYLHFTNDLDKIKQLAFLDQEGCNIEQDNTAADDNCKVLNRAPGYFNFGLMKLHNVGEFFIMSTRNNGIHLF
jgi:hypothetical protein